MPVSLVENIIQSEAKTKSKITHTDKYVSICEYMYASK